MHGRLYLTLSLVPCGQPQVCLKYSQRKKSYEKAGPLPSVMARCLMPCCWWATKWASVRLCVCVFVRVMGVHNLLLLYMMPLVCLCPYWLFIHKQQQHKHQQTCSQLTRETFEKPYEIHHKDLHITTQRPRNPDTSSTPFKTSWVKC